MPGPGFEWIGAEEEKEVLDVLRSRWLFRYGDEKDPQFKRKVKSLEEMVEKDFDTRHALAVTSGTAALITALSALGIGPGDEVIVPGYTFIASISSVIIARAVPVLAEVDESLTLDPEDIEKKITPRTRAIMAVHMLGNPCDLSRIEAVARKHNLILIEDAAQAFGGSWKGKKLGTIGRIGIYSFNIFKTINARGRRDGSDRRRRAVLPRFRLSRSGPLPQPLRGGGWQPFDHRTELPHERDHRCSADRPVPTAVEYH